MRRRLLAFLLLSATLLGSGCTSVLEGIGSVPVLKQVIGYPLFIITMGPGMMVLWATSPYFSTPRAANWSSLDDGPVKRSYVVIGVTGYSHNTTHVQAIDIDPGQGNICGLYSARIRAPESTKIRYQIYEAPPGDYYSTLPDASGQSASFRFKVKTGEIVYLGDYNFNEDSVAYSSSFDALYKFASRYHVDLTRLATADLEPVSVRPMQMCTP